MKYTWSEVFTSIEGEGPHSGVPTVYARFTQCNFECKGFNNPTKLDTTKIDVLGFDPADYKDIYTIPMITKGCDSIYSWDSKFKHMWVTGDEHELASDLIKLLPNQSFILPSGKRMMWSITGGEPTLHAKKLPTLFNHPTLVDCQHILIETNCAVPLKAEFIEEIKQWLRVDPKRKWTWSNSPKLFSQSGEPAEKAIRPDIALMQNLGQPAPLPQMEQYFKFVCDGTDAGFAEVEAALASYYDAGISRDADVYIMPMSCTQEQQNAVSQLVANECIKRGYTFCYRVHSAVYGNTVGT